MKASFVLNMALFSFALNAANIPATNGSYYGIGQATSNILGVGNDYETKVFITDSSISSTFTDRGNDKKGTLTYDLIRTGEGFFKLSVKLRYNDGHSDLELTGDGIGNCLYDACHFNSKIEFTGAELEAIKTVNISDVFYFDVEGNISRKAAADIYLIDDPRTVSFVFNEKLTITENLLP